MAEQLIPLATEAAANASNLAPIAQYVKVVEQVNPWTYVLYAVIIVCVTAILLFMIHDQRKRQERKPDKKPSPLVTATIISLAVVVLLVVLLFITGQTLEPSYLLIFPLIWLIVYFGMWREVRKLTPLKKHILKAKAWEEVKENSLGTPHRGDSFGSPVMAFNYIPNPEQPAPFNMLVHWLFRASIPEGLGYFYLAQSLTDGEVVKYIQDPDSSIVDKFLGKQAAEKYDFEKALIHEALKPDVAVEQMENGKTTTLDETQTY